MGLPVIRLSKVLELPLQQNQGWLERVWCCCWTFSELEVGSSLQLFWYFPRNWQTLLLQQPPAFWERSLQAGNNCCLSKAVLLCFIIPHLAFLMKVLVRVVLRCKDVHKAKFPCLCLQWSLAPVWGVYSWFSGGIFRHLHFETGDYLTFCLAAPLETINRPAEKRAQWSCVPESCSAVLRGTLGTSCWEKVAVTVSFSQGHLMVALSAADPTISILWALPGQPEELF